MKLPPGCNALVLLLVSLLLFVSPACALRFYMNERERRCFKFNAPFASRVIGQRSISNGPGDPELHIEIVGMSGRTVYESSSKALLNEKFSFMTPPRYTEKEYEIEDYDYEPYELDGTYTVCLLLTFDTAVHTDHPKRAITFWIRPDHGIPQRGLEKKADQQSVDAIITALEQMQNGLKGMVTDITTLQRRERRLVALSQKMKTKLTLFSVVALFVIAATATVQVMYFGTYFKTKKLI